MTASLPPSGGGHFGLGSRCLTGALYSIIYGSLCILLVFLGFIWCSSSHSHQLQIHQFQQQHPKQQQLPNNLQNHRLSPAELSELTLSSRSSQSSPTPVIQLEAKESRIDSLEGQQPNSNPNTIRRSYQSSGYGNGGDYSGYNGGNGGQYGGQQSGQPQQYGQQIGRQFDPMFSGGGGGGYPGMNGGFGMGASGYYPSGFGLENRFLSLFPRRSSFYQPFYPYGPFGAGAGSYFPGSPFGGGMFGQQGGGFGGSGGYPMGGGGLGSAFGALGRLAQASSLLTGGLQSYRERLQPGSMLGSMAAAAVQPQPQMHHYSGEVEGSS